MPGDNGLASAGLFAPIVRHHHVAVNELWRESGGQFDRALVPLFVLELERDSEVVSAELPASALLPTG